MVHKDYIMRMIETIINVMLKLIGLKKDGHFDLAMILIEDSMRQFTGFDIDIINKFTPEELVRLLKIKGHLDIEKCIVMAVLLKERADIIIIQGFREEGKDMYEKSLALFNEFKTTNFDIDISNLPDLVNEVNSKLKEL